MTAPSPEPEKQPRDTAYWAEEVSVLKVERVPTSALNLNVEGHQVLSPLQGFGQLWQNAAVRTTLYTAITPLRRIRWRGRGRKERDQA
ncbi:MAG TPA: hypothetical protein VGT44_12750 [Ktedonobacteraceae bacterium]|nr:hypothetical protein [Ktedonobacteraceae bacterium]